jgi:hypothetical protein
MERSMTGAGLKVLNTERSVISTQGAKCQSTEKSVDRHEEPSTERGAIRERCRVQVVESGAIRDKRGAPSVEYGAIRERGGVLSAELRSDPQHEVIRGQYEREVSEAEEFASGAERKSWEPSQIGDHRRANKAERGAICAKLRTPSVEREVIRERCERKVRGPATRDVF